MKNFVISAVGVLAVAAASSANIMEMSSQGFGFGLSPGGTVLTFNKFDTQGGLRILKAVELQVEATIGANVTAENDSMIEVSNFGVNLTGLVDVASIGGLAATLGIVQSAGPVSVAATDGVAESGPDFHDFGALFGNDSDSDLAIFGLGIFEGPGTFDVNVDGSGGFATSGTTDASIRLQGFGAEGAVKVIYYYDLVPTPGSAAMLGLAGLVGLRRRR